MLDTNTRTIFNVAVDLDADMSLLETEREALDFIATKIGNLYPIKPWQKGKLPPPKLTDEQRAADLKIFREALRQDLLASLLLGEKGSTYSGEFHGGGDSGNYDIETGDATVDTFLMTMCDIHIDFDWYNNDGGGGDIEWNIQNDVITINGYQNITAQEDMMTEVEV